MSKNYISENVHFIGGERDGDVESIHGNWAVDHKDGGYNAARLQRNVDGVKHVGLLFIHESMDEKEAVDAGLAKWAAE